MVQLIQPNWPAPNNIIAGTTTKHGGVSTGNYATLNLGVHVEDNPEHVAQNRAILAESLGLLTAPLWLQQTHSTIAIHSNEYTPGIEADACYSDEPNHICAAMTADCLPVLICHRDGSEVAAIHAGWKGLADGVIESTCKHLKTAPENYLVWLGPAIGPEKFEVGADVIELYCQYDPAAEQCFKSIEKQNGQEKWLGNLYQLATQRLKTLGIKHIYGGEHCTHTEDETFFSYRRDGVTGRMVSFIFFKQ